MNKPSPHAKALQDLQDNIRKIQSPAGPTAGLINRILVLPPEQLKRVEDFVNRLEKK